MIENQLSTGSERGRCRRVVTLTLACLMLLGSMLLPTILAPPTVAMAASMGPGISGVPGIGWIGAYKTSSGRVVYCTERGVPDPWASFPQGKNLKSLPAYEYGGVKAPALKSAAKMRQLNYILDRFDRPSNAQAAAAAVAVWDLRNDNRMHQFWTALNQSAKGKKIAKEARAILADAKLKAVAPKSPKKVTGKPSIQLNKDLKGGTVSYPAGTTSLTLTGATFVSTGKSTLQVRERSAASARFTVKRADESKKVTVSVSGTWKSAGTKGWEPEVRSWKSTRPLQQRVAVATGSSTPKALKGTFSASASGTPVPTKVSVVTQAQPSADLGGTMHDVALVSGHVGPGAGVDFTAYLLPQPGAIKFDEHWDPVLGDAYEAQGEDPDSGEPLWDEWWADAEGEALLSESGEPIPATQGSSGTAADGTEYPVEVDGAPSILRTPVMEERRDPVRWTEDEIAALSDEELCLAQPVARTPRVPVPSVGSYASEPVTVRSAGTIHWVERYYEGDTKVHEGICGLSNERTSIGMPGVQTQAQERAVIGEPISDTAIVSGRLAEGAEYSLVFEAYIGDAASESAECTVENRIFRSEAVAVDGPGEYESPSFAVRPEHGETVWWVERLMLSNEGTTSEVHRGECGIPNETTTIDRPEVVTQALEQAVVGDHLVDTAIVSGGLSPQPGVRWELTFDAYGEQYTETDPEADPESAVPVCEAENRLFTTGTTEVTGPGEYESERVPATTAHIGTVWWVETLWIIQDEERTAVHRGECGLLNETTEVTGPEVTTLAVERATVGESLYDTALVSGPLSDRTGVTHEVTFEAYSGAAGDKVCTAENLLFTTGAVEVTGPGEFESPRVDATPEHVGVIWWVETLWLVEDDTRTELHRGECGLENETTIVEPAADPEPRGAAPSLPVTGGERGVGPLVAMATILLLLGGAALVARRSTKRAAASQDSAARLEQSQM